MSKPKYWWYGNVVRIIRAYPELQARHKESQRQSITANYSAMPKGGGNKRVTENAALRGLSRREEAELEAVRRAVEDIGRGEKGAEVLKVIELYHWRNIRNFDTVGYLAHMSRNTAKRRNSKFVYAVAKNLGYL